MPETIHLLGEGGSVFEFDLPLHEDIAKRLDNGQIKRVNPDGSPWVEPAEKPKDLTPKEKLQGEAAELGLDTSGTVAELQKRIDAALAE